MTAPILVAGAGGRLGRAVAQSGGEGVLGLDRCVLDIADADQIAATFDRLRPIAVINAAAMAAVDACETNFDAAIRVNSLGPGLLAKACAARAPPFLHFSTDYLFGAEDHDRPRREADLPCPINAYGRSNLLGEVRVRAAGGRSVIEVTPLALPRVKLVRFRRREHARCHFLETCLRPAFRDAGPPTE